MKSLWKVVIFVLAVGSMGCASMSQNAYYSKSAKEHTFEYFFPSSNFAKSFSSIDEAYEYIQTATVKFSQTVSNKYRDKGLAARLQGPKHLELESVPAAVVCIIRASDTGGAIDLLKAGKEMTTVLNKAEDALLFFFVFHNNRIISLSNFYLDPKYSGYTDGNAQIEKFGLFGNTYEADYPAGWSIEKAFRYLKGELD